MLTKCHNFSLQNNGYPTATFASDVSDILEIENSLHASSTEHTLLKFQEKWVFIVSHSTRLLKSIPAGSSRPRDPWFPQALTLTSCTGIGLLVEAVVDRPKVYHQCSLYHAWGCESMPGDKGDLVNQNPLTLSIARANWENLLFKNICPKTEPTLGTKWWNRKAFSLRLEDPNNAICHHSKSKADPPPHHPSFSSSLVC